MQKLFLLFLFLLAADWCGATSPASEMPQPGASTDPGDQGLQFVFWLLLIFVALLIGAVLLPASKKAD